MVNASRTNAAAALAVLATASFGFSGDQILEAPANRDEFVGTLSCTSASCHGSPAAQPGQGQVWQQVYARWLGVEPKYQDGRRGYDPRARLERHLGDPHALAGQRMGEPRFQEVLRRYSAYTTNAPARGARPDADHRAAALLKCARCHDPLGLAASATADAGDVAPQGIGCESCHGPAKAWLAVHFRLDVSRGDLQHLGMIDTKDLLTRARVCASCHVGSSENDMNHDMIAAGHPPLRFEMASYEALLPSKHWEDGPRRLAEPDYEVQLWAAGQIAAAEAALKLLAGRAERASARSTEHAHIPWPEFAESNCFACHQNLKPHPEVGSYRLSTQRGSGLPWQTWNNSLLPAALGLHGLTARHGDLTVVRWQLEGALVPDVEEVARAARTAHALLTRLTLDQTRQDQPDLTHALLSELDHPANPTWDELCQRFAALAAARRALEDAGLSAPVSRWADRQRRIAALLRQEPARLNRADLATIARELQELQADLLDASAQVAPAERLR